MAQHAVIPATLATMFEGLADTLDLHRRMLDPGDEDSRREDEVFRDLAARWRAVAGQIAATADLMAAQRDLPMGAHDESVWGEPHIRAFEKFVRAQNEVLTLLDAAARRDEQMLAALTGIR